MSDAPAVHKASWIATRRWFRAKDRRIAAVTQIDRADLGPGQLTVVEVRYEDGGSVDHYLVPHVDDHDPADGDGAWAALAAAIEAEARIGSFAGIRTGRSGAGPRMAERRLTVEQSNSSVVLDERLILKVYRLLEPGGSPDIEIGAFLARVGFSDTPRLYGSMRWEPGDRQPSAVAMLQDYVPSEGDGWAVMLAALDADPDEGIAMAAAIGDVTARLHAALASDPDDPAFPVRPASAAEAAAWQASAERQLALAVAAIGGDEHDRLVRLAPAITARFADSYGSAGNEARVTRIHGDYHLGQLLARKAGGFSVIDFEGEPARPLAERRVPASPLRDVAGMLRSFDYAATTAARSGPLDAGRWVTAARAAFLGSYGTVSDDERGLLAAFELEKALYEVRYEAANRPGWLALPLTALERLLGAA